MAQSVYIALRATLFLFVTLIFNGCVVNFPMQHSVAMVEDNQAPERYCTIFCFRQAGYAGQGRIHTLKIDDRPIGPLMPDNYYRIELWPGSYTFTVYLPEEIFLGQTSHALSFSKHILLKPGDAGLVFILQYADGMKTNSFAFFPVTAVAQIVAGRTLNGSIGLHDTAKVLELFDANYEGPSLLGKAHGWGTLTWPDGCVYQGVFEYGEPTTHGRFFFTGGEYFRGLFRKGRPYRSGLLFARDNAIVFAGRFMNEKPHGQGIRFARNGPELCVYDHGKDITKTVEQQAQQALDTLEAGQVELQQTRSEKETLIAEFARTRYTRELGMRKQIKAQRDQAIARERKWCQSEFARYRRWCQCAPFADDYQNWTDCRPR
jgi:hypothetical protein